MTTFPSHANLRARFTRRWTPILTLSLSLAAGCEGPTASLKPAKPELTTSRAAQSKAPTDTPEKEKPELRPFTSEKYGFSIMFPDTPKEENRRVNGRLVNEFRVRRNDADNRLESMFLTAVIDGFAEEVPTRDYILSVPELALIARGTVVSLKRAETGGKAGVEMIIESNEEVHGTKYVVRHRSFSDLTNVYVILCCGRGMESVTSETATRFFSSFQLSKSGAK